MNHTFSLTVLSLWIGGLRLEVSCKSRFVADEICFVIDIDDSDRRAHFGHPPLLFPLPDSTETQDSSSLQAPSRKPRPQAAFYPHVNTANKEQKPFSRSAAK